MATYFPSIDFPCTGKPAITIKSEWKAMVILWHFLPRCGKISWFCQAWASLSKKFTHNPMKAKNLPFWFCICPRAPACVIDLLRFNTQAFLSSLVVKTLPSNVGGMGLIPDWGAKIPHALWPKPQNIKQKQYCNKFSKDLKNGPHKKIIIIIIWKKKKTQ